MLYFIQTYGCQMNENDSEILAGQLRDLGYEAADSVELADVIVINTCCVRESAEKKIDGKIGELKFHKTRNPRLINIITGCMAQKNAEKILKKHAVLGPQNLEYLADALIAAQHGERVNHTEAEVKRFSRNLEPARFEGLTAYIPIMHGCNNFCSYCIVPHVRGREVSRPSAQIVAEITAAVNKGYKEIMLLGQNVNSYGKDCAPELNFAELLRVVDAISGVAMVRYMTSHPRDMSDDAISVIARSERITDHFHLPVQAGNDTILMHMNRGYTSAQYLDLLARVRAAVPKATLTTDIIVGFPGETEAMFNDTLRLVQAARFDQAYTFIYSQRSGTPAATMDAQIPLAEKKLRLKQLMDVQNAVSLQRNQEFVGRVERVIVQGSSRKNAAVWTGRTSGNKIVLWQHRGHEHIGDFANIHITDAQTWLLRGELVD